MSERSLINNILKIIGNPQENLLGNNEDAVAFQIDETQVVVNVDAWVESTDRIPGYNAFDCGFRAAINSISDVFAKSSKPLFLLSSIGVKSSQHEEVTEIVKGLKEACSRYNIIYLGGDLNQSNDMFVDVTVIGISQKLCRRDNAKSGESVYWLGPQLGENTVAFGILLDNWIGDKRKALEVLRSPSLFPQFLQIDATAAIDCSDGLARTLHLLAEASNVGIDVMLPSTLSSFVTKAAETNGRKIGDLIFYGGEELGIVFTAKSQLKVPRSCVLIGKTINKSGVFFEGKEISNRGWDHFK